MRVTLEGTAESPGPQPAGASCPQIGIPGGSLPGFPWEGGRRGARGSARSFSSSSEAPAAPPSLGFSRADCRWPRLWPSPPSARPRRALRFLQEKHHSLVSVPLAFP